MPIVRLIYVTVDAKSAPQARALWNRECAPLMIQQPGCLSEKLLECTDNPGEFISYSEWDSDQSIEQYRSSEAHDAIKKHTRGLQGTRPVVKRYQLV